MNPSLSPQDLAFTDRLSMAALKWLAKLPLPMLQRIAQLIGHFVASFPHTSMYRTVLRNIERAYPKQSPQWHQNTTKASIVSTAMTALEFAKTWGMAPAYSLGQIRDVHGRELFMESVNSGDGVMCIVPHWGTWEFMNAWVNASVAPTIMYKPGKKPGVDALVLEARGRLRANIVPTDDSGVRATFKALKKGGFTAILPDHTPNENGGIFAPFFGTSTWTGVMVPKLIQRTTCRVIVMGCMRRLDGQGFDLYILPADPAVHDDDLATAAAAMNRSMEALVAIAPEQYQWTYKRFKRNEHEPDFYRF
ncbi:MAG: lysophospholipid acyltransferase family protein [Paraperlucidibaca sp.]